MLPQRRWSRKLMLLGNTDVQITSLYFHHCRFAYRLFHHGNMNIIIISQVREPCTLVEDASAPSVDQILSDPSVGNCFLIIFR
ncbi:hypothetical protein QQP08_021087 [Theobroma cacao]|nr:hypothetical protein QQP08_021087 [Theobroma cacao]